MPQQLTTLQPKINTSLIVINVKVSMIVVLIELYPSIPLSATLTTGLGHSSINNCEISELCIFYPIQLKHLCNDIHKKKTCNLEERKL